jgi:hypothetical protein
MPSVLRMLNSNVSAYRLMLYAIKESQIVGVRSMQIWWNASVMNCLEEENSGHGSKTKSTVDCAQGRSSALGTVVVTVVAFVRSFASRVLELALTLVFTLDGLLLAHGVVVVAGHVLGRLEVEGALDGVKLGGFDTTGLLVTCQVYKARNLRGEVAAHVPTTTDALKASKALNFAELGVVGDLQVVGDFGQHGEGNVGEVVVGNDGEGLTDRRQVGRSEHLETVVVETERAVQGLQRRDRDGATETEGEVTSPDEVRKFDLDVLVVVGQGERLGDVAQLHLDGVNVAVVGNEDGLDLLDVDTLERTESRVLDIDLLGGVDLSVKANVLEVGQGTPLDGVDVLELGEAEGVEIRQALEAHLSVQLLQVASAELLHLAVVGCDQVTNDLLDTADGDVVGRAGRDGDVTREGGAAGEPGGVAGVLDGGGRGDAARRGWRSC